MLTKKRGFTLLELMVAAAILTVCVSISIGVVSLALAQKAVNTQMLLIQNNFSSSCATITDELRSANWPGYTIYTEHPNPFMIRPINGAMDNELVFVVKDPIDNNIYKMRYFTEANSGGATRICQEKYALASGTTDPDNYTSVEKNPLTPYLTQITNMYFTNSNGKITVIMNAKLKINGRESNVVFLDTVYMRNFEY